MAKVFVIDFLACMLMVCDSIVGHEKPIQFPTVYGSIFPLSSTERWLYYLS